MSILPTRFTKGQLKLQEIVEEIGLDTILEYEFCNYRIDIYLPEVNKGIEYDGVGHHKKRDSERDLKIFDKFGVKILRINDLKDPDLKQIIKTFIDKE
jgi:very-short-patch-repair endonuclease